MNVNAPLDGGLSVPAKVFPRLPRIGIPSKTLLESGCFPIEELAEIALREGHSTSPLFRVHRWFARRLGSQFRGILTALSLKDSEEELYWERYFGRLSFGEAVVLDPFVGGGTILVEASRCDTRLIGYDIDPIATFISRFELGAVSINGIPPLVQDVCNNISARLLPFHQTSIGDGTKVNVLHHFWVEHGACPECGHEFDLHPHHQLGYSKDKKIQWVFCSKCEEVHELDLEAEELKCSCGEVTNIQKGPLQDRKVVCPDCQAEHAIADIPRNVGSSRWRLFAQEYLSPESGKGNRFYKKATDQDRRRYDAAASRLRSFEKHNPNSIPRRPIPAEGRSDQRPLIHGFERYRDLFNDRQLLHLAQLGQAIAGIGDESAKRLMATAFSEHLSTNCMYSSYAFGYRRLCPLFSIHSYRHITRPVEVNPWVVGRGTFPNALNKLKKAIAFAQKPSDMDPAGGRRPSATPIGVKGPVRIDPKTVVRGTARAAVKTKSSVNLVELPEASVDLVLTDPPYFDNVSYSEMSDFYLAWHQVLGIAEPPYDEPDRHAPLAKSLVVNPRVSDSIDRYRADMERVFKELYRVLKPHGICVFTYHHGSAKAWVALGEALVRSGFRCTNVLPMRGEGQGGLHSFDGTIKWDAVMVCRKGRRRPRELDSKIVVIPLEAVEQARSEVARYVESLAGNNNIAFREPDQVNLFRGLLVSKAVIGKTTSKCIPFSEALGYNNVNIPSALDFATSKDVPTRARRR